MEKRTKKKSIFLFFLKMVLIFAILDVLMMVTSSIISSSSLIYKYGDMLINEIFYAFAVLIIMLLFKNSYVFTTKKEKFFKGVFLALPMFIFSILIFFGNILSIESFSFLKFINLLILSIFVGIAEEFLCRGWLQNEFIERFSSNKKEVITSIILSSLVFGLMHIFNLSSQSLFETIIQIINAMALGLLLGSVYYKTKNIWSVIFLHSFYDFSILLGDFNVIKDCTYNTPTFGIVTVNIISVLIISIVWVLTAVLVLNKCEFIDDKKNKSNQNRIIKILIVITILLLFIPFEKFVDGYDNYEVCYSYNKIQRFDNYIEHYPKYNKYTIEKEYENKSYYTDEFSDLLTENVSINQYTIDFYINNKNVYIKNNNTGYRVKLDFNDVNSIELLDNKDEYLLVIQTNENETTIYTKSISKELVTNDNIFIDSINTSFNKYELPLITKLGYITKYNEDIKYPYMVSPNNESFIISENKLFVISK